MEFERKEILTTILFFITGDSAQPVPSCIPQVPPPVKKLYKIKNV